MEKAANSSFPYSLLQKDIACLSRNGGLCIVFWVLLGCCFCCCFPQRTQEMYTFTLNSLFSVFSVMCLYTHKFWSFFSQLFLCYCTESYLHVLSGILWYNTCEKCLCFPISEKHAVLSR